MSVYERVVAHFKVKDFDETLENGRLAQLVAHHIDIVGVAGSSPVSPTIFL